MNLTFSIPHFFIILAAVILSYAIVQTFKVSLIIIAKFVAVFKNGERSDTRDETKSMMLLIFGIILAWRYIFA